MLKDYNLRVNTNVNALHAKRQLESVGRDIEKSSANLSGNRLTRAANDPTGLAISASMNSKIRSNQQANRNANDSISMIQTGEGAFNELQAISTRMRELAIQSANDPTGESRDLINIEFKQIRKEMQRIVESTDYNGTKLLSSANKKIDFQVGIHNSPELDRVSLELGDVFSSVDNLGLDSLDVSTKAGAQNALNPLSNSIHLLGEKRAQLGSIQSRMVTVSENLGHYEYNQTASVSRIRDTDMAKEVTNRVKLDLQQAAGAKSIKMATVGIQNQVNKLL